MKLGDYTQKLLRLLRVRPTVGGLEISDFALRYAELAGGKWTAASLRLPPGLIVGGKIADRGQFIAALKELHSQITPKSGKKVGVAVALGSVDIYSQVFSLPVIEGENLERAIQLNIQMASPAAASETYSGWQAVGEDKQAVRLEILSAFVSREMIDAAVSALREAGFVPHSVEPRALSLTRLIREMGAGFDKTRSYLVLSIDEGGIEILVIRQAHLYFQYFTAWRDVYGGEKQISQEAFENAVVRSLHQVINFYRSHWSEPLGDLYLSTAGLKDEVQAVIKNNFSLNILELQLKDMSVPPDWFVVLGSALRGLVPPTRDQDLSLLGISARDEFRREQVMNFLDFWMVLIPASLSILLAAFILAEMFLLNLNKSLDQKYAENVRSDRSAEIQDLQKQVTEFNKSVALIQGVLQQSRPKFEIVDEVREALKFRDITLVRFRYENPTAPITLNGLAKSESDIRGFAEDLAASGEFSAINLPLSDIRSAQEGVRFSITFNFTPSRTR